MAILKARNVVIKGDSQLVIKQILNEYKCNNDNLAKYLEKAKILLQRFDKVSLEHISWQENAEANELEQIASGYKIPPNLLNFVIRSEFLDNEYLAEVFTIDELD